MTELDLSDVVFSGTPLTDGPIGTSKRLVIMGQSEDVETALRAVCAKTEVCALAGEATASDTLIRYAKHQLRALTGSRAAVRPGLEHVRLAARFFGITVDGRRAEELDPAARARLRLAVTIAAALTQNTPWLALNRPFDGIPARARAGIRGRLLDALDHFELGAVFVLDSAVDAGIIGGRTVVLELDQVADAGDFGQQLRTPRSNLAADLAGVNVFSGLARRGWLSIGHSQVRAKTELDGKVFVTIPTGAVRLSFDEFSPIFDGEAVFEALVVGLHDKDSKVQVTLSPSDTEVGLALQADLFDFSAEAADNSELPWGVLHPDLGADITQQSTAVRPGTRLWVEVDTAQMRAYPVENASPTAVMGAKE